MEPQDTILKSLQVRGDIRDHLIAKAVDEVNVRHNNRAKHIETKGVDRKARATRKLPAKQQAREARRKAWDEWRDYREFARHEAKSGRYALPVKVEIPKTRVCIACSMHQYPSSFNTELLICDTCHPQVDATRRRLAEHHASLARARKVRKPGEWPS